MFVCFTLEKVVLHEHNSFSRVLLCDCYFQFWPNMVLVSWYEFTLNRSCLLGKQKQIFTLYVMRRVLDTMRTRIILFMLCKLDPNLCNYWLHDLNYNVYYLVCVQIGWSYKRPRMQGVKFTINSNCKEKILGQIRERLMDFGESTYKEFTDSCFGHFTNLPEVVGHCNSAIHYVISYEMKFDENRGDPTEISFFINNTRQSSKLSSSELSSS